MGKSRLDKNEQKPEKVPKNRRGECVVVNIKRENERPDGCWYRGNQITTGAYVEPRTCARKRDKGKKERKGPKGL